MAQSGFAKEKVQMGVDGAFSMDPWHWFRDSFARAQQAESFDPARAALATVDAHAHPSVRFVLVKLIDERGLAFFTNYQSRKARDLEAHPYAALAFHWASIGEQVRFEGAIERVSEAESDAYFASRPRGAQLSAWASDQSQPIEDRSALQARAEAVTQRFAHQTALLRPTNWGGFRLIPTHIEFWHDRADRMHDRWTFTLCERVWKFERLQP